MRLQIPLLSVATAALLGLSASATPLFAQSGCARCAPPSTRQLRNNSAAPWTDVATKYQPSRDRFEETPPVPSPYYATEPDDTNDTAPDQSDPNQPTRPTLVPTKNFNPKNKEKGPAGNPASQPKPSHGSPSVNDKITQRYSDPRIIRMVEQMSVSNIESMYTEISQLIDGRHITPATYARRVDSALDHLSQAVENPAFAQTASIQAPPEAIAGFQKDLQDLRSSAHVRSMNDALSVLRNVQLIAAQTIDMNPTAVGLEFVYGATDSLDQFSMLLPPEKSGGPSVGLRDNVVGIGVEVESHPSGLKILKLLPGGPAAQADLRKGDVITHIDGHDLKQLELNQAVDYIVGQVGTPIQIQAARGNKSGRVTLTRQKVAVQSVVDVRMQDRSQGIGYLKLEQFADSSASEMEAALMKLHQQGMKSLIIDLRGNPGGLLTTAISLSDKFLPSGTIVSTRGRNREDNTKEIAKYEQTWSVPLVVLVDRNSASASEIFAAAIQENKRGLIIGEKSYGKGTVQTLFPLQTCQAALRLTTAKFYSPQGHEMAGVGVTPDIKIANDSADANDDPVLSEATKQAVDSRVKQMASQFRRTGEMESDSRVAA